MEPTISRGLNGIYVDTSRICHIDGEAGELVYRGYDIRELTDATFEEVVYLLWHDDLPTQGELRAFREELAQGFDLPSEAIDLFRSLPEGTDPMHALRTGVSLLAAFDEDPDGVEDANLRRIGRSLVTRVPALVSAFERVRKGLDPVDPDRALSLAQKDRDGRVDLYALGARGHQDLAHDAVIDGLELHRGLVGLDFGQEVAGGDAVPFLDEPLGEGAFLHRRRQGGHQDGRGHVVVAPERF